MYEKRSFEHAGREYEVRFTSDGHTMHIRVFLNGKPANGYTYSVEVLTQIDAKMSGALIDPVEEMIKTAISDAKNGMWEKYVAAVSGSGNLHA